MHKVYDENNTLHIIQCSSLQSTPVDMILSSNINFAGIQMENLTTKKKVAEVAATACWHKLINEIRKNIISFVRNSYREAGKCVYEWRNVPYM